MALPAKKVSLSVVVVILLLFSAAASFSVYARTRSRSYGEIQSDTKHKINFHSLRSSWDKRKYQIYFVLLRDHSNGEATDDNDKDARRRWYESFLPGTLTDSGEPRLLHCYTFRVNGFLARLTRAEAMVLANRPGLRSMFSDDLGPYSYSKASCGFETTASTKTPGF